MSKGLIICCFWCFLCSFNLLVEAVRCCLFLFLLFEIWVWSIFLGLYWISLFCHFMVGCFSGAICISSFCICGDYYICGWWIIFYGCISVLDTLVYNFISSESNSKIEKSNVLCLWWSKGFEFIWCVRVLFFFVLCSVVVWDIYL